MSIRVPCLAALILVAAASSARAEGSDTQWHGSVNLYAWVSDTDIGVNLPNGPEIITINALDAFKNVKLAVMGGGTISRGRFGLAADVVYAKLSANDSVTPADSALQAEIGFDAQTMVLTLAPFYTLVDGDRFRLRLYAGARHLNVDQTLSYTLSGKLGALPLPDIKGDLGFGLGNWDGIVGLSGEWSPHPHGIFVPAAVDIGGGASTRTWQYVVGVGYRFPRLDVTLVYRDLNYALDGELSSLRLRGPAIGAAIRF